MGFSKLTVSTAVVMLVATFTGLYDWIPYPSHKFTFYSALRSIASVNLFHLLHNMAVFVFFNHFLLNWIYSHLLAGVNLDAYNEILLEFLSDAVITVASFPYVGTVRNILHFSLLYFTKALSTLYNLKSERESYGVENRMFYMGIYLIFQILLAIYLYLDEYSIKYMNVYGLLILEYTLICIGVFKNLLTIYIKSIEDAMSPTNDNPNPGRTAGVLGMIYNSLTPPILLALINMHALVLRIATIFIFALSLSKFRLPINFIKLIMIDLRKLKVSYTALMSYIKVCNELENQEDYVNEESASITINCVICTDDIFRGKKLSCSHVFHVECLKSWCERESTCPICRKGLSFSSEIVTEDEIITVVPI